MADGGKITYPTENWAKKEEQRKNPNHWVEELRPQIMERIKHYEDFLEKWGIIAQTGIEQEFYVIPKDKNIDPEIGRDLEDARMNEKTPYFQNSPFIEDISVDHVENGLEIIMGKGNGENIKNYPHQSLKPSTMVRAAEKTNEIIAKEAKKTNNKYDITGITFDPTEHGERMWAQQINISLWDKKKQTPLFNGINDLCKLCIKNTLETQNGTIALLTVNNNSFKRFNAKEPFYNNAQKKINFSNNKAHNPSLLFRTRANNNGTAFLNYIENRLGNSDMPPSVNMLITLAGVAKGVEEYIEKHNIKTPEELHTQLEQDNKTIGTKEANFPEYGLPKTQTESLAITKNSKLAEEILGKKLHRDFVKKYKQHLFQTHGRQASAAK